MESLGSGKFQSHPRQGYAQVNMTVEHVDEEENELFAGRSTPIVHRMPRSNRLIPSMSTVNKLMIAACTVGLFVIGTLAALNLASPVVVGGVCIGFATAAGALYSAKGGCLRHRVKTFILRTLLTSAIIAGGALGMLGILQVAQVGYLILGATGGLAVISTWNTVRERREAQMFGNYVQVDQREEETYLIDRSDENRQ